MTYMNSNLNNEIKESLISDILKDKEYIERMKSEEYMYDIMVNIQISNRYSEDIISSNNAETSYLLTDYNGFKIESINGEISCIYDEHNNKIQGNDFFDYLVNEYENGQIYLNEIFEDEVILDYFIYKDSSEIVDNIYSNEENFLDKTNITENMEKLALKITKNEETDYYKAKAMEDFFNSNDYEYSLKVEKSKLDNPIEYFIFSSKKGYCVQYATAMVLLCRAINIPARYVEGYYITEGDKVGNTYEIKESNAHGFVQVYLSGYGWKNFDPTPGFSDENSIKESVSVFNENKKDEFTGIIYVLFGITIIIIFVLIILKVTYRYRKLRKILKLPNEEALENLIAYSIELLRNCNINYSDGETELEFAERVDTILNIEFKNSMQKYYNYKYALKSVSKEDVNKSLVINKFIYKYIKKNKKKLN